MRNLFPPQVWSSKCQEVASLSSSSPLNCVAFDPEGRLLAAGCWNGNVIMWNWLQNKVQKVGNAKLSYSLYASYTAASISAGTVTDSNQITTCSNVHSPTNLV